MTNTIPTSIEDRLRIIVSDSDKNAPDFAKDVLNGLTATPKIMRPLYLYDQVGSELFEQICQLPEYYITRTEHAILRNFAGEIISCSNGNMELIELGSGSSTKTVILIEALIALQGELHYLPIDISSSILVESSNALLQSYPELSITAHVAEYNVGLHRIAEEDFQQKMIVFLGSNLGNFEPEVAFELLQRVRAEMDEDDFLLIGLDLEKDPSILLPAYDDSAGITARFNMNLLVRINRELGGQFDLDEFSHLAVYNEEKGRIEMHLRSQKKQSVWIEGLNRTIAFEKGETIHTENSYKYSFKRFEKLCKDAGFRIVNKWLDENEYFSLNLLAPA